MSLYRYIRDKDDLMDEVVEQLLIQSQPLPAATGTWQARLTAAAEALRHLLVQEPGALYVYLRHPVISPTSIRRMELMLKILREAGFDAASAKTAYAAIQTYTVGFAAVGRVVCRLDAAGRDQSHGHRAGRHDEPEAVRQRAALLAVRHRARAGPAAT